jgi:hypothetical protein
VDQEEIAMLVGKLHAMAGEVDVADTQLVPISKAAEKAKVPAVTVVHMILGGFLKHVVRLAGAGGITALRVDPGEVKRHAAACTKGISPMEAFIALKIPKETGWGLVDRCPQEVSLAVDWIACPTDDHRIPRFNPAAVAGFKTRFTHPARIAEHHGLQIGEVVRRLKQRGVRPVLTTAEIGVDFYRVRDLKPDLFI